MVTGEADNVTLDLETERNIEVLGNMALGPEADVTLIVRRVTNGLNSLPAQEGVVTDEGGDLTTTDGEADSSVDKVGEVCNTVLKVIPGNLHDTSGVLDDSDFRRQEHLGGTVHEAVFGNDGIGVDNENDFTHANVTTSLCARVSSKDLVESLVVERKFLLLRDGSVALVIAVINKTLEYVFDAVGDVESEVHVGGLLELSAADETFVVVLGARDPSNVVVLVESKELLVIFFRSDSHTIVVDENAGGSTTGLVVGNGGLQTGYGGLDNTLK